MLIAGDASGDMLAAELITALRAKVLETDLQPTNDAQPLRTGLLPVFFGAGGPRMAAAGLELTYDMTQHSVIGIADVLRNYFKFRRLFLQLLKLAIDRKPDVIIGVDYGGFNLRFARAIKRYVGRRLGWFQPWNPKIAQYVSPQVWASRPGRVHQMARSHDLVLSIFPFEKEWYARREPELRVEFVGHPMVDRFTTYDSRFTNGQAHAASIVNRKPQILLLPGSRKSELQRHLPVMLRALEPLQSDVPGSRTTISLPNEALAQEAKAFTQENVEIQVGNLPQALAQADVAIASTGTVTMECAYFGVPTVTLYKLSWAEYEIAKRVVTVKSATMPNLLAGEEVYPEFIQHAATSENIAAAALDLLKNETRRQTIRTQLAKVVASLGGPGANIRAAEAIVSLLR
jgi:lipid-A-disaccharide synthase